MVHCENFEMDAVCNQLNNIILRMNTVLYGEFLAGSDSVSASLPLIVINEIMADPTPIAGLPDREYIELYNTHSLPVNLKGWILGFGSKQKILPDITISAGGFLLLTATGGAKDFLNYCKVIEVSGLSLNNSGVTVSLYDSQKRLTDQVDYTPSRHKKGFEDGGYSLERIDPYRFCGQQYNWATTLSKNGGTPGAENSVKASNYDHTAPYIMATTLTDYHILEIQLSECSGFSVNPADGLMNVPSNAVIDSISNDNNHCILKIYFRPSSLQNGITYSLIIHGLKDDCGNFMPDQTVKYGYYIPVRSDILINEVLFNPYPGGSDFVEIYNNSGHEVDLSGLFLATRDESNVLKQISQLSSERIYMPADSYLTVTKSIEGIIRFYRSRCDSCLLQVARFPTLVDQAGCVVLLNLNNEIIDEMNYSEEMHNAFITDNEGISLERISFSHPASQNRNWHSAAKYAGFATPGYKNSVMEVADSIDSKISIEPEIFSPNGDGFNDQLNIHLNGIKPGELINITILNSNGRVIRKLANNLTTSGSDNIFWDGSGPDFKRVHPGIYVLNISLFEQEGMQKTFRRACVITDHL